MSRASVSSILQPVAVTVPRAAELLGISTRTAWELVRTGTIPAARLTRRVLIPYAALVNFIESRTDSSGACVDPALSARRKALAKGGAE